MCKHSFWHRLAGFTGLDRTCGLITFWTVGSFFPRRKPGTTRPRALVFLHWVESSSYTTVWQFFLLTDWGRFRKAPSYELMNDIVEMIWCFHHYHVASFLNNLQSAIYNYLWAQNRSQCLFQALGSWKIRLKVALYTKGSAFCEPTSQYGEIAKLREGGENLCMI